MRYKGSCHCGAVAFEVEGELSAVVSCNCSICARRGSLLWAMPRDQLRLLTPEDAAATYTFNKHFLRHRFCRTCGIHPYAESVDAEGKRSAYVNIRCLDGVELAAVPTIDFDGRSV
ncbi:MAG: GFA family protein [Kiloniellales bacterium]